MSGSLSTLLLTVTWKGENVPNELNDIAKEIYKQSSEDADWILATSSKVSRKEINEWLLNRNEQELDAIENS